MDTTNTTDTAALEIVATCNNIKISTIEEALKVGAVLAKSGFFRDIKSEQQAVAKILQGQELGIPPVASLQGIYVIEGKLSLSAGTIGALLKKSGKYDYKIPISDATRCSIEFFEKIEGKWQSVGVSEFAIEDALRAELTEKRNWKHYPKSMLFSRALSQGARMFAPDIFYGAVYCPEELGADVAENGEVIDVEQSRQLTTVQPALPLAQATEKAEERTAEWRSLHEQSTELTKQFSGGSQEFWKNFLQTRYGKRSRQYLSEIELSDLCQHLQLLLGTFNEISVQGKPEEWIVATLTQRYAVSNLWKLTDSQLAEFLAELRAQQVPL